MKKTTSWSIFFTLLNPFLLFWSYERKEEQDIFPQFHDCSVHTAFRAYIPLPSLSVAPWAPYARRSEFQIEMQILTQQSALKSSLFCQDFSDY